MARPLDPIPPALTRLAPSVGEARAEVLCLHGAWGGAYYWRDLAGRLTGAGYGVSLLDLPGHGGDRWKLPATTSLADYAGVALRAVAGLGNPILLGHSLGGFLIQKIWERHDLPGALLAPLPGNGLPPAGLAFCLARLPAAPQLLRGRQPPLPGFAARRLFGVAPDDPRLLDLLAGMAPEPPRVLLEMGLGLVRARPRPGRAPRLVVAGGRDPLMPVGRLRRLARGLGAEFALVPGGAHHPWLADGGAGLWGSLARFLDGAEAWAQNNRR